VLVALAARRRYGLFMADRPKSRAATERENRLEAALRENLKRRKAQARARLEQRRDAPGASHDSAGIPADKSAVFSGDVGTGSPQKTRQS
jgi:hypothetical protein